MNSPTDETGATATTTAGLDRRSFMSYFAGVGLGSTLLPGVLWSQISQGAEITAATVACAEEIAGLSFDDEQRARIAQGLRSQQSAVAALRRIELPNSVAPAIHFNPLPAGMTLRPRTSTAMIRSAPTRRGVPSDETELAFLPVTALSELVRRREVTSLRLTEMYLARLKRYDPILKCVVNLTEERALAQARAADEEIARGRYRGPLHGIPWGAKDLLAVRGTPTTWGTAPYQDQMLDEDATVVQRLDAAGAVLVAKLTLGELAQGDLWFGGRTNNPWNIEQGSSGSSAGPGSATAAGLVAFAIGSETLGSISSPATRNGVTGLRPTFGRVPKTGAMALSWSMDKLGPMCRSAEDCALVLDAIHGADGRDHSARDADFVWDATLRPGALRIGYVRATFERPAANDAARVALARDVAVLDVLRAQGATLIPVELPEVDTNAMRFILSAEAAAAFDDLTRSGRDQLMNPRSSWPGTFRTARFYTAVDYINANRARTLAIEAWAKLMSTVDVIVTPTGGNNQLTATNLTGHPAVILPHGFTEAGTPVSITFLGQLFEEARLLAVANAYQQVTDFHTRRPPLDG